MRTGQIKVVPGVRKKDGQEEFFARSEEEPENPSDWRNRLFEPIPSSTPDQRKSGTLFQRGDSTVSQTAISHVGQRKRGSSHHPKVNHEKGKKNKK